MAQWPSVAKSNLVCITTIGRLLWKFSSNSVEIWHLSIPNETDLIRNEYLKL